MLATALAAMLATAAPTYVATYQSLEGETLDAFAVRISKDMVEASMHPSVSGEVCGEFRLDSGVYTLRTYTIGHTHACSYQRTSATGYTGLTHHTHVFIGETGSMSNKLNNPRFSDEDYQHPGYMTTGKVTVFQAGRGTVRRVSIR